MHSVAEAKEYLGHRHKPRRNWADIFERIYVHGQSTTNVARSLGISVSAVSHGIRRYTLSRRKGIVRAQEVVKHACAICACTCVQAPAEDDRTTSTSEYQAEVRRLKALLGFHP
jgi:hypothetical protein